MSKNTHRVLALFVAATLTTSNLVACAPKGVVRTSSQNTAPTATDQPSGNASNEQKPTTSQNAQPNTTDTNSNSNNAAPTSTTSNSTSNSTSNNAAPTSTTSNATSNDAAPTSTTNTNATPTQTGITGWLTASCRDGSNQYGPDVTSATLSGDTLTLEGNMAFSEDGPTSSSAERSTWVSGPITLVVGGNTRWEGRGGIAEPMELEPEKVLHVINTHGGLGLVIEADNGVAKTIAICS